jgi:glycosyltransferase involved in cell wall biosynthesis
VVPQEAFILLWLGGYNHWCDVDSLFEAVEQAMSRDEKIHFVSTGGQIDGHNESAFPRFQAKTSRSPHRDRYHFQGWIESDEVPNYLLEANAGINVDRACYEAIYGARHRMTEMLQAGLPVITTQITEISHQAVHAGAALGSETGAPQAMADHILFAAGHPRQLVEMGVRGRELFLEKFTHEITTRPLLEWLKCPQHAPDWGKDIPHREDLLYEKLKARPMTGKIRDFLRSEIGRRKKG